MAKLKDKATIIVKYGLNYKNQPQLFAVSQFDGECLEATPIGTEFDLIPRTRRSLPQHRMYWATLSRVVKATGRWPTAEKLHDAVVRACGYVDVNYGLDGNPYVTRDSTAFDAMNAAEFRAYFDQAMEKLAEAIGFDPLDERDAA
jgi:hypothetical protein